MTDTAYIAIVVACLSAAVIALSLWHAHELKAVQDRVEKLECIHVIFEDGSSMHTDAEAVQRFCKEVLP